jgi:hypothetical protein
LDDSQFEAMVLEAFSLWASVDCGGGQGPGFLVQSGGVVEASAPSFCSSAPRENTSVFFFVAGWPQKDFGALGFTHTSFLPSSAEILDADVKLNADYVNQAPQAEREAIVRAVIEHEVGHFLGLSHSNDPNSVMATTYDPRMFLLPALTTDDVDGICAVFPRSNAPTQCPSPEIREGGLSAEACVRASGLAPAPDAGCSVSSGSGRAGPSAWLWVFLCLLSCARVAGPEKFRRSRRRGL